MAKRGKRVELAIIVLLAVAALLLVFVRTRSGRGDAFRAAAKCGAGKHYDARQRKCVCDDGTEWDAAKKRCAATKATKARKTWKNVTINRFGDYRQHGQGQGQAEVVMCQDAFPHGHDGIWTAANPRLGLKCGSKLRVTDPQTKKTQELVVMDGGGSEGLDIDDIGYRNLVPPGFDGLRKGYTVELL